VDELPPWDMLLELLLRGVVAPAGVAVALLWPGGKLALFDRWARVWGAAALAGGFFAGYALSGWAPLVPRSPWHWLPYAAALAVVVGLRDAGRLSLTWLPRGGVALAAAWLLVPGGAASRYAWLAGLALAVLAGWFVLDRLAEKARDFVPPLLLAGVAGAAAFVLLQAGSAKFAQLAGTLAAVLGAFALLLWRRGERAFLRGAVPGIAVLIPGLMLNGWLNTFGGVHWVSFALVGAAPLTLGLTALRPLGGQRGRLIQASAALVPAALGVLLALFPPSAL
jgi:hypothetical protein